MAAHNDIRAALAQNPPQHVQARLNLILAARAPATKAADSPPPATAFQQVRAVQVLERIADPAARKVLKALAALPAAELSAEARAVESRLETPANRGS
jgi:hypothetical protein